MITSGEKWPLSLGAILLPFVLMAAEPAAPIEKAAVVARPFPLQEVQLLDSPFKANMERNAAYLLSLEPDRLLHNTRKQCGLEPKAPVYGGWESLGFAGHTLGHYLTALSQQYAATGDPRFRERIDYIVGEMAECQARYGDGYVGAARPRELAVMRQLKEGKVDFKGALVPWYGEHKILAGLRDAWILGGSGQAREVVLKLAGWVDAVTAPLTPAQQQEMLRTEFGGMPEILADLYARTGDPRYLETARRFRHEAILGPLAAGRDELTGKHANTQVPKLIGEARLYEATGDEASRRAAEFFWSTVVNHRSFAIGGNSDREHFFPEEKSAEHLGPEAAESCNTYNMLKLTEHLFGWKPDVAYGDYYERALYNHILASQEPKQGMFTYFISHKPGHFKTYSTPTESFWCCVGTGMENHTKYGEAIYFHGADDLYVNLFIPSRLSWKEKGLVVEQRTEYPDSGKSALFFKEVSPGALSIKVRCPGWATEPLAFRLNGQPLPTEGRPGQFAEIRRSWQPGDCLEISIPMGLRTEPLPGTPAQVAFLYGPLVLAGDLGPAPESANWPYAKDQCINDRAATVPVPLLVADDPKSLLRHLKREPGPGLVFKTEGLGRPQEAALRPFKDLMYNRYALYWEVVSPADWQKRETERQAAETARLEAAARIVDEVAPGEQQSETDHGFAGERSQTGDFNGRKWRDAREGGRFSYVLKIQTGTPQALRCTYWGDEGGNRVFDILVDGQALATQKLDHNRRGQFFDVDYPIPPALLAGKEKATITFQAKPGAFAGGVFHAAVVKAIRP